MLLPESRRPPIHPHIYTLSVPSQPMLLYVKVKPNQRFDKVEKIGDGSSKDGAGWQIRLKAPAVDGKANEHLVDYMSEVLGVSKSKIMLKKGRTARVKCLEVDMDEALVIKKLAEKESSK